MTYEQIEVAVDGNVATVTLNRPDALNAITPMMLGELNGAYDELAADPGVQLLVLTGAGRAFSAGVDLKALGDRELTNGSVGDILDVPARSLTDKLANGRLITVAKVNGFCFTGALELALACDLMVTAEEAKMADTHAKFGLRPTWGMSQRLPALVGLARARELSFTARTFTGTEAAEMGMACMSAPRDDLDACVDTLVASISESSMGSLAAYKDLYRAAESSGLDAGLAYEYGHDYTIDDTDDRLAGFR